MEPNDKIPTEGGGMTEYHAFQRSQMAPRNISPEVMGKHKAMVFNAVMREGFSMNAELAGWESYTPEKKQLLISGLDSLDDIRYVLNRENDNDVLAFAIAKKRELETLAQMAELPVK